MSSLLAAISGFCIAMAVSLTDCDRPLWRKALISFLWCGGIICAVYAFGPAS